MSNVSFRSWFSILWNIQTNSSLTTLGSVIAVYELLHASNGLIASVYRPMEIYTFLAVAFFVLIYPIILASQWAERYFARRA